MKKKNIIQLLNISIWKTLRFNLHYFGLNGGVRLPVFVYRNFKLDILKGNIQIKSPLKTGMIHIGYSRAGIVDTKYQRGILQMKGRMIFYGKASFSAGVKIGVTENATVIFGDNFSCNANTDIICNKEIIFGNDVILSWTVIGIQLFLTV